MIAFGVILVLRNCGGNLNTDIQVFEADRGFAVRIIEIFDNCRNQQKMVLLSYRYLSNEIRKNAVVYFQVYHVANGPMVIFNLIFIITDTMIWTHFSHYCPFVRIRLSYMNSPQTSQWCGALMFSLMLSWTICWTNSRLSGDLRRHDTHLISLWYIAVIYISWITNHFIQCCFPQSESLVTKYL